MRKTFIRGTFDPHHSLFNQTLTSLTGPMLEDSKIIFQANSFHPTIAFVLERYAEKQNTIFSNTRRKYQYQIWISQSNRYHEIYFHVNIINKQ